MKARLLHLCLILNQLPMLGLACILLLTFCSQFYFVFFFCALILIYLSPKPYHVYFLSLLFFVLFYTLHPKDPTKPFKISYLEKNVKPSIQMYLKKYYPHKQAYSLLQMLIFGEKSLDNRICELRLLGLAHFLAISGWHFSMLAFVFLKSLGFLNYRKKALFVFFLVTAYFLFLGFSVSVFRSYISIAFLLLSHLFDFKYDPLQPLALSCVILMLYNPYLITSIAGILSYLATLSILLFYPPLLRFLTPFALVGFKLPFFRACNRFFLQALCLSLAAHLLIVFPLLHYFQSLVISGFFYALLYPPLFMWHVILFCLASFLHLISEPLASSLHAINHRCLCVVFDLVSMRIFPHVTLYHRGLSIQWSLVITVILIILGLTKKKEDPFLMFKV